MFSVGCSHVKIVSYLLGVCLECSFEIFVVATLFGLWQATLHCSSWPLHRFHHTSQISRPEEESPNV